MTASIATPEMAAVATDTRWFDCDPVTGETLSWSDDGGKLLELEAGWAGFTGDERAIGALLPVLGAADLPQHLRAAHDRLTARYADWLDALEDPEPGADLGAEFHVGLVSPVGPEILVSEHSPEGHQLRACGPVRVSVHWPPYGDGGLGREDERGLMERFKREAREAVNTDELAGAMGRLFRDSKAGDGMSDEIDLGIIVAQGWKVRWTGPAVELAEDPRGALGVVAA